MHAHIKVHTYIRLHIRTHTFLSIVHIKSQHNLLLFVFYYCCDRRLRFGCCWGFCISHCCSFLLFLLLCFALIAVTLTGKLDWKTHSSAKNEMLRRPSFSPLTHPNNLKVPSKMLPSRFVLIIYLLFNFSAIFVVAITLALALFRLNASRKHMWCGLSGGRGAVEGWQQRLLLVCKCVYFVTIQ